MPTLRRGAHLESGSSSLWKHLFLISNEWFTFCWNLYIFLGVHCCWHWQRILKLGVNLAESCKSPQKINFRFPHGIALQEVQSYFVVKWSMPTVKYQNFLTDWPNSIAKWKRSISFFHFGNPFGTDFHQIDYTFHQL